MIKGSLNFTQLKADIEVALVAAKNQEKENEEVLLDLYSQMQDIIN
jgi:hypothetical protein